MKFTKVILLIDLNVYNHLTMKKTILLSLTLFGLASQSFSQCDSINIGANYTISADQQMSGTFVISGDFTLESGATLYVTPYSSNSCGQLKIYANRIFIYGNINGDLAGYEGGTGGLQGTIVSSPTGNELSLTECNSSDNTGDIILEGGFAGTSGAGPGAGLSGSNGTNGSGSKQYCGNSQDEAGLVAGPGGAGGGAGGSYGGTGSAGGNGGNGSSQAATVDLPISNASSVIVGLGGNGGASSPAYGTSTDRDIAIGSGGAGAGGGGRSYGLGSGGAQGGKGGGMVFLKGTLDVQITGSISVQGGPGALGGNGGSGDATADCCSDGCNGCDERTFSAGAGAGAGAGGGSGGGIFIETGGTATIGGILSASGGNGGAGGTKGLGPTCDYDGGIFCGTQSIDVGDGENGNAGGGGGGGRIKIYVPDCASSTISATMVALGGNGFTTGNAGTIEEVCGYAGLGEITTSLGWNVFPNPANDILNVQIISGTSESTHELLLFDALGKQVHSETMNNFSTIVNIDQLPSGIYTIQVLNAKTTEIKRFVKY